jgi:predicted HTH transcriptional regulator
VIVEIPDPPVILSVVLPILIGVFSFFVYLKIRQFSASNSQNKVDSERLEFYERQLIDMKIKLDSIEIENLDNSYHTTATGFENDVEERSQGVPTPRPNVVKTSPKPIESRRRTPNMGFDDVVETVLGLITDKSMTSRDIQVTLGRSREHISRTMKKLYVDGFVERNMQTKPFSYSITEKGRQRIGLGGSESAQMAPQVV